VGIPACPAKTARRLFLCRPGGEARPLARQSPDPKFSPKGAAAQPKGKAAAPFCVIFAVFCKEKVKIWKISRRYGLKPCDKM
jgi:hypothetical protein